MSRYFKDEGIVLKKKDLLRSDKLITIFSKNHGRIILLGYGVKKITSRRLSHLETGNYIKFSFYQNKDYFYLTETDLIYGYSKIKKSLAKINLLFILFSVLNKILPENQNEQYIFELTLNLLKQLNNVSNFGLHKFAPYIKKILIVSGFITEEKTNALNFDVLSFAEDLIGQKIKTINSWS